MPAGRRLDGDSRQLVQRREPSVDVLKGLILGISIAPLQRAFELVSPSVDCCKIVAIARVAGASVASSVRVLPLPFDWLNMLLSLARRLALAPMKR